MYLGNFKISVVLATLYSLLHTFHSLEKRRRSSRGNFEKLNSAGNTSVTPFNNVTVAYSSLPRTTGIAANIGATLTDREPMILASIHRDAKVSEIALRCWE